MSDIKINEESKASSQLKELLTEGDFVTVPKIGDLVQGAVIDIGKSEVRIDIDGLTTGIIRGRELFDESNEYNDLNVGDVVEATVIDLENESGEMELSLRHAGHQKAWNHLATLKSEGSIVHVTIVDANKGGLMVRLGKVAGFLPVSQLMPEHYPRVPGGDKNKILERLKEYVNEEFEVKVIDIDEAEDKLIVSEKAAWEEKQKEVISSFKVGDVVTGTVTAVTDFGVFVEFGPQLEGLIHISELAWQRIDDPADIVKVGDEVQAEIINIEGSKIFLSTKKLKDDPWKDVEEKYSVGQVVEGTVLKVNPFGLFVELDNDIHGLAHISELSNKPVDDVAKIAKSGDTLQFKILSIEPKKHRLGLSLKALKEKSPAVSTDTQSASTEAVPQEAPAEEVSQEATQASVETPATDKQDS